MNTNDLGQLLIEKATVLKPYTARPFKHFELMSDQELMNGFGGYMIVDTECYPNFWCAYFKDIKTQKIVKFEIRSIGNGLFEGFNERKLSWILHSYTTIGFNSIKYDLPMLWAAYKYNHPELLKEISNDLILNNMWPTELQKKHDFKIWPTRHVDLIEVCPGQHSLKLYMGRIHSSRLQDLPFPDYEKLDNSQIEIVGDYCLNDLDGTEELLIFNSERLNLRDKLSAEFKINVLSKSDAQMAEAIVAKEIKNKTGQWPKKNTAPEPNIAYDPPSYLRFNTPEFIKLFNDIQSVKLSNIYGELEKPKLFENYYVKLNNFKCKFGIGGLHSCEENISYQADENNLLVDRDVSSYYPRILVTLKLFPKHLGPVFLEVYETMMNTRLLAKKDKSLFTKAQGLKIATNGISGKLNSEYSIVYSPKCYIQMTLTGQLGILMLVEFLECNGIRAISANTDGIVMYCPKDKYEKLLEIIKYWEDITSFQTEETQYKKYYARDVNAYFALKLDNSIKVKGPYSEVGSQTGTKLDNNPITLICSDAIKQLITNDILIEKTINECRDITRFVTVRNVKGGAHKDGNYLGKVVRWYYAKNVIGTINYIISGNKVPDTDGAKECMDLPKEFPADINYDWYISKTKEMLYDLDYYKRPRQIKFF